MHGLIAILSRMSTWTLYFDAHCALVIFYLSFLLLPSLSYCIRKRLISDVISDSSLIRKVTQPELGSTWWGNALPSLTNSFRIPIGNGRSANLPPCMWPISLPLMRNSVPPNLWGCKVTLGQLINSVLTFSNISLSSSKTLLNFGETVMSIFSIAPLLKMVVISY